MIPMPECTGPKFQGSFPFWSLHTLCTASTTQHKHRLESHFKMLPTALNQCQRAGIRIHPHLKQSHHRHQTARSRRLQQWSLWCCRGSSCFLPKACRGFTDGTSLTCAPRKSLTYAPGKCTHLRTKKITYLGTWLSILYVNYQEIPPSRIATIAQRNL